MLVKLIKLLSNESAFQHFLFFPHFELLFFKKKHGILGRIGDLYHCGLAGL